MKDLNYVANELMKDHNMSVNIQKYGTGMSSMYCTLAYIKFAMNYYTLYDIVCENDFSNELFDEKLKELNLIVKNLLIEKNTDIDTIEKQRNEIKNITEVITQFVDRLQIYEYVLNRIEYRFSDLEPDMDYFGTYFTNDIMHYILSDKDNVVINSKISNVVGQLPIRLSKTKFYNYVKEAFTLYHGAQKGTIDDFAYALRTVSMLEKSNDFDSKFPELYRIYTKLNAADYGKIDKNVYDDLAKELANGAEIAKEYADMFVLMEQLINDLYTIALTQKDSIDSIEEIKVAIQIIESVWNDCQNKNLSEEVTDKFEFFEGKQERILMITSKADHAIEKMVSQKADILKENNAFEMYDNLLKVLKLQSGSDFVELYQDDEKLEVPDDSYADKVSEQFINDLDELFKESQQQVKRAVMAAVLSQLPVFFNNTDEICEYINLSLEQCADKAEQIAVVEIMKILFKED